MTILRIKMHICISISSNLTSCGWGNHFQNSGHPPHSIFDPCLLHPTKFLINRTIWRCSIAEKLWSFSKWRPHAILNYHLGHVAGICMWFCFPQANFVLIHYNTDINSKQLSMWLPAKHYFTLLFLPRKTFYCQVLRFLWTQCASLNSAVCYYYK